MTSTRENQTRTETQALVVFFFKLRTGNSNKILASILQLEYEQLISENTRSIIKSFQEEILPFRFGLTSSIKGDLTDNHTTEDSKKLFGTYENLFLICDGTYARHQRSTNNGFQRKSFSGQKKVSLCKPFTICTTDGYVVDMLGPYPANVNDEDILRNLLQDPNGLCKLLQENDYAVLDRGFRDVRSELELQKINVSMPSLKGNCKQLTTRESNESRYVTKIRWAVEAVHGILTQKYGLLHQTLDNKFLPKIATYLRIASFLNNLFGQRLKSDSEFLDENLERMKKRKDVENALATEAEEKGWWRKRSVLQRISANDILDLAEIIDKDRQINLQHVKDKTNVFKLLVPSRHISRKAYKCFIIYKPNTRKKFVA